MKLEREKISYIQESDNLYRVLHNGEIFSFTTPIMGIPFGVDQEYGKIMCRLEYPEDGKMNTQYMHLKKIIEKIEKYVCEKFEVKEDSNSFKSVIRKKDKLPDLIECRIKEMKNNVVTKIEYENKSDNYLKGIFDIPEKSFGVAKLEWFGVFDYRDQDQDSKHKIGILLYINKILIKE